MTRREPARVVVLGGGFGGLYAAAHLARADLPEGAVDVTLVSEANYFSFTPLLAEVVGGSLGREHVTFPHRILARRHGFRFILGRVEGVEPERAVVHTTAGSLRFDHAILAVGSRPRYHDDGEIARRSFPLASVTDALAIRDRVIELAERAVQVGDADARRRLLSFVVAGAGPAGVEAAAEIWRLLTRVLPRYYDLGDGPSMTIVDGGDRILRGWDEQLAASGVEELRGLGIDVSLHTLVERFDGSTVCLNGPRGETEIEAETLIWTAGTTPATEPFKGSAPTHAGSGALRVDEHLRVEGFENLYAVGDAVRLANPRTGSPYPPVAPIAISQGVRAAANVENAVAGRAPEPYRAHHAGKIVSLGGGIALVDLLGLRIRGRPAWAVYRVAYLLKLPGVQNKLRTAITLLLNQAFERDLACLPR